MKILLTGGGTAGSVSPLLAIAQQLKRSDLKVRFLWLGTKNGPEKRMTADYKIEFKVIAAGKLRRYFDLRNFLDIARIKLGFVQAFFVILKFKPDIILSAGSFVSVPVVWAGWFLGVKSIIHQQDVRPGLANKLMVPLATKITVTFEESLEYFPKSKTVWTGNPVREEILKGDRERAIERFGLERGVPTLLVMGGGTGSMTINKIVVDLLSELTEFCQVVHLTGSRNTRHVTRNNYHAYEFLNVEELADAYAVSEVVVSRCGLSSLTELSVLGKPVIFIPLADTHQEDNAKMILEKKAGKVIWQKELTGERLIKEIKDMIDNRNKFSNNIKKLVKEGTKDIINQIMEITNK